MSLENRISPHKEPIDPIIQTNLDVVARHFLDEASNNIAGVLNSYTDDITWIGHIRKDGPLVVEGKDAASANYHSIFDALEGIKFDTLWQSATKEYVFDRSTVKFTVAREGHFSGLQVGQEGELNLVHIFRMRDGKICKEEVYEMPPDTVHEIWKSPITQ